MNHPIHSTKTSTMFSDQQTDPCVITFQNKGRGQNHNANVHNFHNCQVIFSFEELKPHWSSWTKLPTGHHKHLFTQGTLSKKTWDWRIICDLASSLLFIESYNWRRFWGPKSWCCRWHSWTWNYGGPKKKKWVDQHFPYTISKCFCLFSGPPLVFETCPVDPYRFWSCLSPASVRI